MTTTGLLYRFDGRFSHLVPIGPVAEGFRLVGHFTGALTAGELDSAALEGVDSFRIRHDGAGVVRGHEVITTRDHETIAVELAGLLVPPRHIDAPRPADIAVPGFAWPAEPYTIHVSASFQTAYPAVEYLNTTVVAHTGTVNFATGELRVDAHPIA